MGGLGGKRAQLAEAGVDVSLDYSGTFWNVLSGGKKRVGGYMDFIELRTTLDGETLYGIPGNTVSVALISSNGSKVNANGVGSLQGIDNNEVATRGVRLLEAWMNQDFLDGRAALLVGVHDLNSEFQATPVSDNFVKPVMQIGQTFAASGRNGPSIFPYTSLAARLRVKPTENSYAIGAVYDGVPGDSDHPRSNPVNLGSGDGALFVGELGYVEPLADAPGSELNKIGVGVWRYTGKLDDLVETDGVGDPAKSRAQGAYLISSYRFFHSAEDNRAASVFFRGGIADGDTAAVDWDYAAGIVGSGWIGLRPDAELGLGVAQAHNSDKYMTSMAGAADRRETSYELYYRDTLMRGVSVQPDLQYIVNPGMDQAFDDVLVAGIRVDVSF